jgi:hypothetical protein
MDKTDAKNRFADLLNIPVGDAMMYLAGVLDSHRAINFKTGIILVQMQNDLPQLLHEAFGGSLFRKERSMVFKAQGKLAIGIMTLILPYLVLGKAQVKRFVKDSAGRYSPKTLR